MSLNMLSLLGGKTIKGGWDLGETKKIPVAANKGIFSYNGMTLVSRDAARFINAIEYPDYYALTDGYFTDTFFKTRTPSSNGFSSFTAVKHAESYGGVMIAVGANGKIGRSTDGGATFTQITSPVAGDLLFVHYAAGLAKWIIFYSNTKALISSDNGLTFVDTTVTGLPFGGTPTDNAGWKIHTVGNNTVFIKTTSSAAWIIQTSTLTTWTAITDFTTATGIAAINSCPRLSTGNGWFVITISDYAYTNGGSSYIYASQTGVNGSWTNCFTFLPPPPWTAQELWMNAPVFDGTQWIMGVGGPQVPTVVSSFPKTGPTPGNTDYYQSAVNDICFLYTSGTNKALPTGNWTVLTRTIGGSYITGWGYDGASVYWTSNGGIVAYYNGPSEDFGTYLFYAQNTDYTNGANILLYAKDIFSQILASVNKLASSGWPTVAGAGLPSLVSRPQMITADKGIVKGFSSGVSFESSGSTTVPGRTLPTFTGNSNTGEGTNCTRIR